ncbi:beta strand repeat-containing protein [Janthinobacterium fluminis]|uniref:Calcium-binding protein n=1 Tax=Janthinobacterium fluminis TaxID=2987524 RepID=A0ABT5JYQ5_9BURK|nr:calcium-binding protein [Janthinobacterium fluminis]MDC8757865.1 calcium-binding protein [Janthinobacterium fluminis]
MTKKFESETSATPSADGGASAIEAYLNGLAAAENMSAYAAAAAQRFVGTANADVLNGSAGADVLEGLGGDDTYYVNHSGDVIVELADGGRDTVYTSVNYTVADNVENVHISAAGLTVTGSASTSNVFHVDVAGGNVLDGAGTGNSANYAGSATGVTATIAAVNGPLTARAGSDVLANFASVVGSKFNDVLTGNEIRNALVGGLGNDILQGGKGDDLLIGALGDDTYLFARGDGADTISDVDEASSHDVVSFLAGVNAEQLWFRQVGTALEVSTIGTSDKITINAWYGGAAPRIEQFRTADGRVLLGRDVQNLVQAMASLTPPPAGQLTLPANYATILAPALAQNWRITGPTQPTDGRFVGTANPDIINGTAGADVMVGLDGDDTYYVNHGGDVVIELAGGGGRDTVYTQVDYTVADNIEEVHISAAGLSVTNNASNNNMFYVDVAGGNLLRGGGAYNSANYTGSKAGVTATIAPVDGPLAARPGSDVLVNFASVEGSAFDDILVGNERNNTLAGGYGNDTLQGGKGNDFLVGALGDDTYVFARGDGADIIGDTSTETSHNSIAFLAGVNAEQLWFRQVGADLEVSTIGTTDKITIRSWDAATPTIAEFRTAAGHVMRGADVQTLVLAMANLTPPPLGQLTLPANYATILAPTFVQAWHFNGPTQPTGQHFVGTANADVINGSAGADLMEGLGGDDTYYVNHSGDFIAELGNGGNDTVYTSVNYTVADNVENVHISAAGLTVTGSAYTNNVFRVDVAGGNVLDGAGTGNSANYVGSATGVTATIAAVNGPLTARAGSDVLANFASVIGSKFNDVLTGNEIRNILVGGLGNDILQGGKGDDLLGGALGDDTYLFARGDGADTIGEANEAGSHDVVSFLAGVDAEQLWFRQVGTALEVSTIGTSDKITVNAWYGETAPRIEQFRTADGRVLLGSDVQNLVRAMANLTPPPAGQLTLPANYATILAPALAQNWRSGKQLGAVHQGGFGGVGLQADPAQLVQALAGFAIPSAASANWSGQAGPATQILLAAAH